MKNSNFDLAKNWRSNLGLPLKKKLKIKLYLDTNIWN